jgi:hypothetical protein
MKSFFLAFVLSLTGCSILTPPTYQEFEYANLIEIAAVASEGECSVEQRARLANLSVRSALYSKYLPHNELMAEGTAKLDESAQNLKSSTTFSPAFCQLKLRVIKSMATTLAGAVGGKSK